MDHPGDDEQFDGGMEQERHSSRDSLFLQAILRHARLREPATVRVRNLSAGGMMAECEGLFRSGDPIEIELRGVGLIDGHIAWVAEGRLGIAFDQEIDPLRARKPVGKGGGVPVPAPGGGGRPRFPGR